MAEQIDLSLVVACYNEKLVLERNIARIKQVLDRTNYNYEIIFVDDCSKDNTREIIQRLCAEDSRLRYLFHEKNAGRGRTVTDGVKIAKGKVAGFVDIDLATAAWYIPEIVSRVLSGVDMCMAWRIYKVSPRISHRWILSRGYHFLVHYFLELGDLDTETGFKFFNREKIIPVLEAIKDPHWFWDTEICARAKYAGLKIDQVPTLYLRDHTTGTTVKILKDSLVYFKNLMAFRSEAAQLKQAWKSRQ
ncbi:glycosyltransferase [bacterium]|nr:glycosyltransferase [bacterium]